MVTVLGVPSSGRLQRTATRPILDSTRKPLSSRRAVAILLVGETVEAVAPLKAREARRLSFPDAAEERLIGLVEPRQHILQDMAVDGRVLRECRAHVLQLGFLRIARERDAALAVEEDALLQRRVVESCDTPTRYRPAPAPVRAWA